MEKPIYSGQNPEVSGEFETKEARPTEDAIQKKGELMREKKEQDAGYFEEVKGDLENLAAGRPAGGVEDLYPGWRPEDFQKLLDLIEQPE